MIEPLVVYAAEREAGLEEQLTCAGAQAAASLCRITADAIERFGQVVEALNTPLEGVIHDNEVAKRFLGVASADKFDLHPIHSILVSTGWNKNDDIFDQIETWKARHTPEDKPFNLGHDPNKIIGHITKSVGIDATHKAMAEDLKTEDLPDKFHILTRSVIYKHLASRDDRLQAEVAELLQGIARNEWFVSMEALFTNFDYGLIGPDGTQRVVARQENTAFLTKHLRKYGGQGSFEGSRLGRVLRNITFSAHAMVRNPANPESVIFNDASIFKGVLASQDEIDRFIDAQRKVQQIRGVELTMADEFVQDLKDKCTALERKLAEATKKLEEMGEQAVQAKLDAKDREIARLEAENKELMVQTEKQDAFGRELEESRDKAVAAKIEAEEKLAEAQKQIEATEAEAKKTSRISALVDKGVEKAEAEGLVASFDDLDDDKFEKLVAMQAELVEAKKKPPSDEEEEVPPKKKSKGEEDDSDDDDGSTEGETDDALDSAEEDKDAAMASEDDSDDKDDALKTSIASYFSRLLLGDSDDEEDGGK